MRRRAMAALAFGAAAAGSAAIGYAAQRRATADIDPAAGGEWAELQRPVRGEPVTVTAHDGTRLCAEVLGPDAAPTLVLAHGYGLSQHVWHYQRRDLRGELRVVAYDQRGHGDSEPAATGDYTMRALGHDLAAVLDATVPHGQRAVVAGHSMGGMTVLSFAQELPEQVERLAGVALMSTAGGNVVAGGAVTAGTAMLSTLRGRGLRRRGGSEPGEPTADTLFLLTRGLGLSPDADPAHVAFTEQLLVQAPGRVKAALGPTLTSLRLTHAAERLHVPALVAVGEADRLTPARQARRLADAIPHARLAIVPGAGHMLPLEAHAEVTAHLRTLAARAAG